MPIWVWGWNWFAPRVRSADTPKKVALVGLGLVAAVLYVWMWLWVVDAGYWVLLRARWGCGLGVLWGFCMIGSLLAIGQQASGNVLELWLLSGVLGGGLGVWALLDGHRNILNWSAALFVMALMTVTMLVFWFLGQICGNCAGPHPY